MTEFQNSATASLLVLTANTENSSPTAVSKQHNLENKILKIAG